MTWLRYADRHILHTVADYLDEQLEALGWLDPARTPFGATAVTISRGPAFVGDRLDKGVADGHLCISLGSEPAPEMQELGGPLSLQEIPLFVDMFSANYTHGRALATDVRDIFLGRIPGSRRHLPVVDKSTNLEAAGWEIEFDDVERVEPGNAMPLRWQAVHVTAAVHFPEVLY